MTRPEPRPDTVRARVPTWVREALDRAAAADGRTPSDYLCRLLVEHLRPAQPDPDDPYDFEVVDGERVTRRGTEPR